MLKVAKGECGKLADSHASQIRTVKDVQQRKTMIKQGTAHPWAGNELAEITTCILRNAL